MATEEGPLYISVQGDHPPAAPKESEADITLPPPGSPFVIYLCCGRRRNGDLFEKLERMGLFVVLIDPRIHPSHDISRMAVCAQLTALARDDLCIGVVATVPCSTFAAARFNSGPGPAPERDIVFPGGRLLADGLPSLSVIIHNTIIQNATLITLAWEKVCFGRAPWTSASLGSRTQSTMSTSQYSGWNAAADTLHDASNFCCGPPRRDLGAASRQPHYRLPRSSAAQFSCSLTEGATPQQRLERPEDGSKINYKVRHDARDRPLASLFLWPLLCLLPLRSAHIFFCFVRFADVCLAAKSRPLTYLHERPPQRVAVVAAPRAARACCRDRRVAAARQQHGCTRVRLYMRLRTVLAATAACVHQL